MAIIITCFTVVICIFLCKKQPIQVTVREPKTVKVGMFDGVSYYAGPKEPKDAKPGDVWKDTTLYE